LFELVLKPFGLVLQAPVRVLRRQRPLPPPQPQHHQRLLHLQRRPGPQRRDADDAVGAGTQQAAARLPPRGGGATEAEAPHAQEPRLRAKLQVEEAAAAPRPRTDQQEPAERAAQDQDGAGAGQPGAGPAQAEAADRTAVADTAPQLRRPELPGVLPVTSFSGSEDLVKFDPLTWVSRHVSDATNLYKSDEVVVFDGFISRLPLTLD
jgi:hypothetical protein